MMKIQEVEKVQAKWKICNLGIVNTTELAKQLFPYLLQQFIMQQQTFLNNHVEQIQISDDFKKWTVLKTKNQITQFFNKFNHDMNLREIQNFGDSFQKYVFLIQQKDYFIQFFQIEFQSFKKVFSRSMQKKPGGRYAQKCLCSLSWLIDWRQKKILITRDGVFYANKKNQNQILQYIPFGKNFEALTDSKANKGQYQIVLCCNHRRLYIKAKNFKDYFCFIYYLKIANQQYKQWHHYRYGSFSPIRKQNQVQFIVDGQDFFQKVAAIMETASVQILISGWWISPQLYLVRIQYRLDKVLKRCADRGVQIYITVYRQSSFVPNDSQHTERMLKKIGPNLKIIRHPNIILPSFWTHHQKMIIIDQTVAFVGGIDLCYGRFDNKFHSIQDNSIYRYPGIQYSNIRTIDFENVANYSKDSVSRSQCRLPWHDVSILLMGPSVKDLTNHFIQSWNFQRLEDENSTSHLILQSSKVIKQQKSLKRISQLSTVFKQKIHNFVTYFNKQKKQSLQSKNPQVVVIGSANSIYKQQNQHIKQKMHSQTGKIQHNFHNGSGNRKQLRQNKLLSQEELQNNFKQNLKRINEQNFRQYQHMNSKHLQPNSLFKKKRNIYEPPQKSKIQNSNPLKSLNHDQKLKNCNRQKFDCQVLRSASQWSIGCKTSANESSIQTAYISLIQNAEHFIYIQNQYLISAVKQNDVAENMVVDAIYKRIEKAHLNNQSFYVIIFLPLVPGFTGQITQSSGRIPRAIMHWQYRTIFKHKNSLIKRLQNLSIKDYQKYIKFYSLRVHGILQGQPKTQSLYIHSKIMIVDDTKAIIGSANINDRSMNGDRDSQICVLIEGSKDIQIQIGAKITRKVNKTIHNLRLKLLSEHFHLPYGYFVDPLNQNHQVLLSQMAKKNTEIYRKVFGCYPDDTVFEMGSIQKLKQLSNINLYRECCKQIKGHVVQYPVKFLYKESLDNLTPDGITI